MSRNLRALDLNLVPVLHALLAERSVTRAARRIGLSQPATSNALGRLRAIMGDPLLVRSGRTMVPTPLGEHLLPMLDVACSELERMLHYEIWSPSTVKRRFVVAMTDYLVAAVAAEFEALLEAHAPRVTVQFVPVGTRVRTLLMSGEIDLAYVGYSAKLADGLDLEVVCSNRLRAVVPKDHAFAVDPPTSFAAFAAARRIGIDIPHAYLGTDQAPMAELLGSAHMRIALGTTHLSTLPLIAATTGTVAVVPAAIAAAAAALYGMTIVDIPDTDVEYTLCQYRSPKFASDPGNRWLRDTLGALVRNAFAPSTDDEPISDDREGLPAFAS